MLVFWTVTHCHTLPHIAHLHRVSHGIASAGNPEILTLGHQTNGAVSRSAQLSILVPGITPKLVSWLRAIRWARIPEACQPTSSPKIRANHFDDSIVSQPNGPKWAPYFHFIPPLYKSLIKIVISLFDSKDLQPLIAFPSCYVPICQEEWMA